MLARLDTDEVVRLTLEKARVLAFLDEPGSPDPLPEGATQIRRFQIGTA